MSHTPQQERGRNSGSLSGRRRLACVLLVVALGAIFVYNVHEHYFLGDDGFISFRYARHVAEGLGPVWNPGERVEGYTNFLWVMLLAAALRLGAAPEIASNVLGILSGAGLVVTLLVFSARRSGWDDPWIWVAPFALVISRSFTAWCSGGLATTFFSLFVFLGTVAFVHESERRSTRPLGSALLFGVACLTRPEGVLFVSIVGVFYLAQIARGKRSLGSGIAWSIPIVVVVGTHLLWRQAYYGYWLPNTFYAKVEGAWWDQGRIYLTLFAEDYHIVWFLPLVVFALIDREFVPGLCATITVLYLTYVSYVGGDRFEFRFLVIVFPFFYWLIGHGIQRLARLRPKREALRRWPPACAAAAAVALLATTHVASIRPQPTLHRHGVTSLLLIESYAQMRMAEGKYLRGLVDQGLLPEDLVLCVGGAGALPYYVRWPTVDRRGINDEHIAHLPLDHRGIIGHERDATQEYLHQRGVVIFDILNRVVYPRQMADQIPHTVEHDGRQIPLRIVAAGSQILAFATVVSEEEFRRVFAKFEVLR